MKIGELKQDKNRLTTSRTANEQPQEISKLKARYGFSKLFSRDLFRSLTPLGAN
jgi:hypothetical protein